MKHNRAKKLLANPFSPKNWEEDIQQVSVEPCDESEDPLGYRAIFFMNKKSKRDSKGIFVIGASYLAQRELNLTKAGYKAPMTHRAIGLIERKIGSSLPIVLAA